MAHESTDSVVTPEKNEDVTNTSKIDSYIATKDSIEKSNSPNINRNVVPHYLRASTGSCHDICKYGNKHSNEEKARKPLRKRIAKSLPSEYFVHIMVSSKQNKEKIVDHNPPTESTKNHSPAYYPKVETSSDKKNVLSTDTKTQPSDKKTHVQKPTISSDAKNYYSKQNAFSGNKPVFLKPKPLSSTKKCSSPEPPEIVKSVFFTSKKEGSSAEKKTTRLSLPVNPKSVKVSRDNSNGVRGQGRKNSESDKTTCNNNSIKAGKLKSASHSKVRNSPRKINKTETPDNVEVSEKILHVVKTENVKNVIELVLSEADELVISDKNECSDKVPPVKENRKKTMKKSDVAVVSSEDNKNRSPVNLKFRNGKVTDVISSPKILKFRKPRVIGPGEGKSDSRRRFFKKTVINERDKTVEKVSSEKIVLKHHDVQGKKDGQGLLNNVIERTANKLAESRKSKVKALVGAFESVISLQESKPNPLRRLSV